MPSHAGNRWPWALRAVAALVLLVVAVLGAGLLAWQRVQVRRAVLARVAATAAARGVAVTAADVAVRPWRGVVELLELSLGVPNAPPWLVARRVTVSLDVASFCRGEPVLRLVAVEDPRLDLAAPAPRFPAAGAGSGAAPARLTVERFVLSNGEVRGGAVTGALARWLDSWRLHGVRGEGSWRHGTLHVSVAADLDIQRPRSPAQRFAVALDARAQPGGPWSLAQCTLRGAGLEADGSAAGDLGPDGSHSARVQVRAEPGVLLPELGLGGTVQLDAEVQFPPLHGTARVSAAGLAADAARPLLPPELAEALALAGTAADLTATASFALAADGSPQGSARVQAAWRRGDELLVSADIEGTVTGRAGDAKLDVVLLPGERGVRRLSGTVAFADLANPTSARLAGVTLELAEPDVGAGVAALTQRWPALAARLPAGLPLLGALDLTAQLDGPAADPTARVEAEWRPGPQERVTVRGRGQPVHLRGEAEVQVDAVRLAPLHAGATGTVSAYLHAEGEPQRFTASFTADGVALGTDEPMLDSLHLSGETDGQEVRLARLAARVGTRTVVGSGRAALSLPLADAEATLHLGEPAPGVRSAEVTATLRHGVLEVEVPAADTLTGTAWVSATVPLAALRPLLGDALADVPVQRAAGPVLLRAVVPSLDSCALAPLVPELDRPERVQAGLATTLLLDPADPTGAIGEVVLDHVEVTANGAPLATAPAVRVLVGERRVFVPPFTMASADLTLRLAGEATLAPGWRPGAAPWAAAVASLQGRAEGSLEAARFGPYLGGASASGPVSFQVRLAGSPTHPAVAAEVDASQASFLWLTPYAARLEGLRANASATSAGDILFDLSGTLNGGQLGVVGSRASGGASEAQVELAGCRFRLDFGMLVTLDGELVAEIPPVGRSSVRGTLDVRRGRLDRPVSLRHELLPFLLAPKTTAGTAGGALDLVDLDVSLRTADGIRVRNNLADVRVRWDELAIRGTAWSPHLEGSVSVDPGGLVRAWGQTVRLDRAVATFTGNPLTDPHLELSLTSSLDDPRIGRPAAGALALLEEDTARAGADLDAAAAAAAASAVGGTLAASLSESLGGAARISVEPVVLFGETDPSARLTVARDLNPLVAFAVSLDLRNAGRQTYLVDLHNIPKVPTLTAQVFTNDAGNGGATFQQTLELGGTRRREAAPRPTLRRLVLDAPPGVPLRRLRRAVGLGRGDQLPEGVEVDVELELEQGLRELGYPDADVTVDLRPVPGRRPRADLLATIRPGEEVAIVFAGEAPPAGTRLLVTSLYRPGLFEGEATEEMRRAAVRIWRSLGHPEPQVTVSVAPATDQRPRTVTVTSRPGRRVQPLPRIQVDGVPADVAARVAATFAGPVESMELAAGVAEAQRRLLENLAAAGYPSARLLDSTLDEDAGVLALRVDAGPRQVLAEVRIEGVPPEDRPALERLAGLAAGDPARRDEAAAAAVRVAEWYRGRGYPDVRVRPRLAPDPTDPMALTLALEVEPGRPFTVTSVTLTGSPRTSPATAASLAAVPVGEPLRLDRVQEGRRRLLATGLFDAVGAEVARGEDGSAAVRFLLEERPPISLAYGLRWESSEGGSAVVDYVDRNLLGRFLTFGARLLYESTTTSGRLYLGAPDVLGTGVRSEAFLERRRHVTPGDVFLPELVEDATRFTFQLSRPLGQRWLARTYGRWQRTHLFERAEFFPLDITLTLPYLGVGLAYDSRDDRILAHRGVLASLDLSGTGPALGADLAFVRMFAQLASFVPSGRVAGLPATWAQSVRLGLAETGSGQELIRSERFFAGGEYSVRGYATDGLGPVEDLGTTTRPSGGTAMLVVNEELRLALPFDLTGLLFVDAGQVWATRADVALGGLALAAGVGVRAATPVGVLRLDAAVPLDRGPRDPRFRLYLGFGSVF